MPNTTIPATSYRSTALRKITNLALVAALAVPAFASTAAAQRAEGCENADGDEVIDVSGDGYEGSITGQSASVGYSGFRTVNYFQVDTSGLRADVDFTITYEAGDGTYNLGINDADGNEIGRSDGSEGVATVSARRLSDCLQIVVFVYADQEGGPTNPLVDVTFTAVED